jgi:hypothetical protein
MSVYCQAKQMRKNSRFDHQDLESLLLHSDFLAFSQLFSNLPSDGEIEAFVRRFSETDFVRLEFYSCLPFLVSLIRCNPNRYRESIQTICHYLSKDVDVDEPDQTAEILESVRPVMRELIFINMAEKQNLDDLEFAVHLAALTAISTGEAAMGEDIFQLFWRQND